jgi:hypothetical protein
MYGIKSRDGRWSVSLCECSQDAAHIHYGNVVLHVSLDDLSELGRAMQNVAENAEPNETQSNAKRKGLVQ